MGYFGHSGFENDDAADWFATLKKPLTMRALMQPIKKYLREVEKGQLSGRPLTETEIDDLIAWGLKALRDNPPKAWRSLERPIQELLDEVEEKERVHYKTGRYLDERYGSVEPALAAAEVIATLGGMPPNNIPLSFTEFLGAVNCKVRQENIETAIEAVDSVLENERYRRMRAFYLATFADVTSDMDAMAGINDLRNRLRRLRSTMQSHANGDHTN